MQHGDGDSQPQADLKGAVHELSRGESNRTPPPKKVRSEMKGMFRMSSRTDGIL
ncbi:MAG: hypothetical protein OSB57_13155 [Planctomycetota bacterium]|nr:hypothetical protein [Planctomycetota bacterium]